MLGRRSSTPFLSRSCTWSRMLIVFNILGLSFLVNIFTYLINSGLKIAYHLLHSTVNSDKLHLITMKQICIWYFFLLIINMNWQELIYTTTYINFILKKKIYSSMHVSKKSIYWFVSLVQTRSYNSNPTSQIHPQQIKLKPDSRIYAYLVTICWRESNSSCSLQSIAIWSDWAFNL